MGSIDVLLSVALIWTIAAVTPGPNFFIIVHTAVKETRRLSLYTVAGIVTGTFIWAISGYFGVNIIFKTIPFLYYFLKISGGCYLIYIGFRLLFSKKEIKNQDDNKITCQVRPIACFKQGLFTNLLNPKTAAFIASLFAATIPQKSSICSGTLYVVIICLISLVWYSIVAIVFSNKKAQNIYDSFKTYVERVAGTIFIFFGIKLASTE